ncbi:hypothetical protein [Staphylospora marina]|uniref:hypothetical protein n=1 Tax=Staphylospora marina TaxID=2490858 RepID=UPI000F5C1A71|nr:hypothetical protein [Staphylospora marina]
MRRFLTIGLKFLSGLLMATVLWIGFIALQQINYSQPDQVYLMGTTLSLGYVFLFLCLVVFFIFTFFKHRNNPGILKSRFLLFSAFYLVGAPLVLLAFDNYLLVTPKGMAYNPFFHVEDMKVTRWRDIEEVTLDYQEKRLPVKSASDVRLRYIIQFRDGPVVDLNHYNSPLYTAEQFLTIHRTILKHGVPVNIARSLPDTVETSSFIYRMFYYQP